MHRFKTMKKLISTLLGFLAIAFFLFPHTSHAAWGFYRSVTATTSATAIPTQQSNFPALIDVTLTSLKSTSTGGNVQNPLGFDIAPFSDSGCTTQLQFERENYVSSTGELEMWVAQGTLNTSTIDYLCYGNAAQTTDLSSSTAPWDSNYIGVWHLSQTNATTSILDSTNQIPVGVKKALTQPTATSTQIDGGEFFNNGNDSITIPTSTISVNNRAQATTTFEFWVNWSGINEQLFAGKDDSNINSGWYFLVNASNQVQWGSVDTGANSLANLTTTLTSSTWHQIAFAFNGTNGDLCDGTMYVDGSSQSITCQNAGSASGDDTKNPFTLGMAVFGGNNKMNGYMDEFRLSSTTRSSSWIASDYWNSFATGAAGFWSVGSETAVTGGSSSGATSQTMASVVGIFNVSNATFKVTNASLKVQ